MNNFNKNLLNSIKIIIKILKLFFKVFCRKDDFFKVKFKLEN